MMVQDPGMIRKAARQMNASPTFVHLRVHSKYSILESSIDPEELVTACKKFRMPALAVTDTNNMFVGLEFATKAAAGGIQPINGCQISLNPVSEGEYKTDSGVYPPIVLLAKNEAGYRNLLKLNSCLYLDRRKQKPHVTIDEIQRFQEGLICLTGGQDGPVGKELLGGQRQRAADLLKKLASIFDRRLYVEIQRHNQPEGNQQEAQERVEADLLQLAYELGLPLVATNNVHFLTPDKYEPVDILFYIKNGGFISQNDPRRSLTSEHYLKSPDDMLALFADLPEAVRNTVEIARRCAFHAVPRDPILPKFCEDENEELRRKAIRGLAARLEAADSNDANGHYKQRLLYELNVISEIGFSGYFLIVADFLVWAKEKEIPVGPGRGSGAGSLVAYAMQITNIDPLRFGLLFERFLNVERSSVPDFDIDFCQHRRGEVVDYVRQRYGRDRVTNIITFGNLKAKAAIRDVGRIMRIPRTKLNALSAAIGFDVPFRKARATSKTLISAEQGAPEIKRMFDFIEEIDGIPRNVSTHAAGIVIGDRPLDELVPLYSEMNPDESLTQFNKKWVEKAGLVKMDFLGLKTLTIIARSLELIRQRGIDVDIDNIALDDRETFELYASGRTAGIFQCDGEGMTETLKSMKPNRFEDIIATIALYRPGPMEQIPLYRDVKNGKKKLRKLHPLIDDILTETHGIVVYQEQVMQIAQCLAGYSMGRADTLRRAMGQKNREIMSHEKPNFMAGAAERGVDQNVAGEIWEFLAKFAEYGFNKSHATGYAIVSYQTAWLKTHYLHEFMASVMTMDMNDADKISVARRELEAAGVELAAPCINSSDAEFTVRDGRIHYALAAVKNVGIGAARHIEKLRGGRKFKDIYDFARRIDSREVTKSALESLARAGAFESLGVNRCTVHSNVDVLLNFSRSRREQEESGQLSLFGDIGSMISAPQLMAHAEWDNARKCEEELASLGYYLTTHPLGMSVDQLKKDGFISLESVKELVQSGPEAVSDAGDIRVAVHIDKVRRTRTRRGDRMAWITISDPSGETSAAVFSDELAGHEDLVKKGKQVTLYLTFRKRKGGDSLVANATVIRSHDQSAAPEWTFVSIFFNKETVPRQVGELLDDCARRLPSHLEKTIAFCPRAADLEAEVEFVLPRKYPVNDNVIKAIKGYEGVASVSFH